MTEIEYFEFKLKPQQKKVFNFLIDFVNNTKKNIFILKGYAGTGKTTLMSGLIKYLNEKEIKYSLLATTGRAAKILSNKTKSTANTIHSHICVFNELSDDLEKICNTQKDLAVDDKGQISKVRFILFMLLTKFGLNYTQAKKILNFRLTILFLQSMLQPLICVFLFFSGLILDQQKPA